MTLLNIPHQRLANLGITRAQFDHPAEVTGWLVAAQAQDFAGAKWGLGLRMRSATDADVEQAFNEGAFLRTHLLRPTWHFVTPDDIGWLLALTAPRVQAVNATMYRKLGLNGGLLARSAGALAKALQGSRQLTRAELRGVLQQAGISNLGEQRMSYFLMNAELEGLICSGPRHGRQFTYALVSERAPSARRLARDEALAELARRYFTSRGPAAPRDFAKWSGLTLADARAGIEANRAGLEHEALDGKDYYWFSPSSPSAQAVSPTAHLLSIYDEYISSYQDRSAVISGAFGEKLWAMGNALTNIILVNGQVVGAFRRNLRAKEVVIETNLFRRLDEGEQRALEGAAVRYGAFLGLAVDLM